LTRGTELTFGIEEEFFVSHRRSRNVATKLSGRLIKDAKQALGQDIVQHELLQCQLELVSPVLETMTDAIRHVEGSRRIVGAIAAKHGLRLVAAGTHPLAAWREQEITEHPRYDDVVKGFQIVGRRNLFCGLHIHVRVPDGIDRVDLMNRAMRWLPLFLAFSTSSPFWNRQRTGLLSYRQAAYDEWPRSGIPDFFANEQQYAELTARLVSGGAMKDASFFWWAIRPSVHFPTLELRIMDACTHAADTIALAALYRSLIAYLVRHPEQGRDWSAITRRVIDENRWRAKRYGIRAELIDDRTGHVASLRSVYGELRDRLTRDAAMLGCEEAFAHLDRILDGGTSADRQLEIYSRERAAGQSRSAALRTVVDWLAEETVRPIDESHALGV
jgi:carboxylate-amine ligase